MNDATEPPCAEVLVEALAALLARKTMANLFFLTHHPALSASTRQLIGQAQQRWRALAKMPTAADLHDHHPVPPAVTVH